MSAAADPMTPAGEGGEAPATPSAEPGGVRPARWATVDPSKHPLSPVDAAGGDLATVLAALGATAAALRVRPGHACLEIGAGPGNLAVTLAQMGCDATYFGLDDADTDLVRRRVASLGVALDVVGGPWQDLSRHVEGRRFDFVLYHAMSGRCADPVGLFRLIRDSLLAAGGRLALVAEPRWNGSFDDASISDGGHPSPESGTRAACASTTLEAAGLVAVAMDVPFVRGGTIVVASRRRRPL